MSNYLKIIFVVFALMGYSIVGATSDYDRPGFLFKFSDGWSVARNDADFNPDSRFTIVSKGDSSIQVQVLPITDSDESVDDMLFKAMELLDGTLIDVIGRNSVDKIGRLKGAGKHMTGNVMHQFPGGAIVFFYRENKRALMLTLIYWKEEYGDGIDCMELIGNSFAFK